MKHKIEYSKIDKMFVDRILFGKSDYMRHLNFGIDYEDQAINYSKQTADGLV